MADRSSRLREGFGCALVIAALVAAMAVIAVAGGVWKAFVRETAPVVLDWPGGGWSFGAVCGLLSVSGVLAGTLLQGTGPRQPRLQQMLRATGVAGCWGVALAAFGYVLASLPGRNCRSYQPGCSYVPGSGSALLTYVITAALLGWIVHRVRAGTAEKRDAQDRERMRRLRKKGKGKSRVARGR